MFTSACAQRIAECADEAGFVVIAHKQHVAAELGFERDALDRDDARLVAGEQSAGYLPGSPFGRDDDPDQGLIIDRLGTPRLADADVALAADLRCIDHIDRGELRRQQSGQRDRGQRLDVELGDRPLVFDGDRGNAGLGQLPGKAAELLGELHVRIEPLRLFGGQGRHIDRIRYGAGQQEIRHLLGDLQRHVLLRLGCRGAEMRRRDDIVAPEERVLTRRLVDKDVDCRAGDMTAVERRGEIIFDDEAAAGAVHQAHAALHLGDRAGVDQVFGGLGQRGMESDEIGAGKERIERYFFDAEIDRPLGRQERIVGDHLHAQTEGPLGDDRADIAAADDAERLAGQLDPHEARLLPFAGLRRAVGRRDLAAQREQHGNRVLGGGDRVAVGGIHHDNAALRRRCDVDIVDADAGPADDLELAARAMRPAVTLVADRTASPS